MRRAPPPQRASRSTSISTGGCDRAEFRTFKSAPKDLEAASAVGFRHAGDWLRHQVANSEQPRRGTTSAEELVRTMTTTEQVLHLEGVAAAQAPGRAVATWSQQFRDMANRLGVYMTQVVEAHA